MTINPNIPNGQVNAAQNQNSAQNIEPVGCLGGMNFMLSASRLSRAVTAGANLFKNCCSKLTSRSEPDFNRPQQRLSVEQQTVEVQSVTHEGTGAILARLMPEHPLATTGQPIALTEEGGAVQISAEQMAPSESDGSGLPTKETVFFDEDISKFDADTLDAINGSDKRIGNAVNELSASIKNSSAERDRNFKVVDFAFGGNTSLMDETTLDALFGDPTLIGKLDKLVKAGVQFKFESVYVDGRVATKINPDPTVAPANDEYNPPRSILPESPGSTITIDSDLAQSGGKLVDRLNI